MEMQEGLMVASKRAEKVDCFARRSDEPPVVEGEGLREEKALQRAHRA